MPDTPDLPLMPAAAQADAPAALPVDAPAAAVEAQAPAGGSALPEAVATPTTEAALATEAAATPLAPPAESGSGGVEPAVGTAAPDAAPDAAQDTAPDTAPDAASDAAPDAATPTTPAKAGRDLSPAACAELLKQHFPALFGGQPKPLKLRIQADIAQRAPGVFSKASMSAFFRRYTGSTAYLISLGKASQRFDLDGQPAGELSEEHRQLARDELTRRRQVTREREQQAQVQQQAQQAEVLQARQARLALLRDFERTTLTPANFCALKGLTPEALEPLLVQARREAAEAPPPRAWQPDDRRGPRADDRDGRGAPRPARPDHRPGGAAGRPDNRNDRRPDARPGARSGPRPELRPDAGSGPRTDARPDGRPDARPAGRTNDQPNGRPAGRPPGRPTER